jgi:amino acid transporter
MNKLFGDGLFAYVQYAFLFIAFFNSATNSLQVGRQLLVAIRPQDVEPDHNVLRLIAVNALSIICLIQYFDPQSARKLNRWLASIKILFLLMVFFAGCSAVRKGLYSGAGFQECHPSDLPKHKVLAAKAMLLVIFSYEGWENATFVAGEINPAKQSTLRKGFIWAVFVVGFLYTGIIAVFLKAIPYVPATINFVPMFYGNNQAAYQAWAILIAISSLGSLNSIIYTFSRIKQSIGFGNVLPWSSFWKKDSPKLFGSENLDQDRAPKGGLVLHWIMSVALIGASTSINSALEAINLSALLRTYSHCIILVVIGIAVLRLPSRARDLDAGSQAHAHAQERLNEENPSWDWDFRLRNCKGGWRAIPAGFAIIYAAFNFTVVIVTAIPPYSGQDGDLPPNWSHSNGNKTLTCNNDNPDLRTSLTFPIPVDLSNGHALTGWVLPVAAFGVVIFATAYYLLVFGSVQKFWGWSLARWAGVKPTIDRDQVYNFGEERVRRFGSRREISFIPSRQESKVGFLYWVFGGSALFTSSDDRPLTRWRKYKNDKIEAVAEPCQSAWVWLWKRRRE